MWETTDPDGRRVSLEWSRLRHVREDHPYLGVRVHVLLEIVAAPDRRVPGREAGEEWFYGHNRGGPSRWIKVVVHYEGGCGRLVTAFPRRSFP